MIVFMPLVLVWIGQFCRDVIGHLVYHVTFIYLLDLNRISEIKRAMPRYASIRATHSLYQNKICLKSVEWKRTLEADFVSNTGASPSKLIASTFLITQLLD